MDSPNPWLPANDPQRTLLHNEVHARPPARIHLPALVTYVAVFNQALTRDEECAHLQQLPGQEGLTPEALQANFLRIRCPGYTLKWERHTEFTRYSIVQELPPGCGLEACEPDLLAHLITPPGWLAGIPGRTIAAIQMAMVEAPIDPQGDSLARARRWLGDHTVVASLMGNNAHSLAVTDFMLRPCGFERMLVVAPGGTSQTRAGRIAARLFELETYRLMALRALPVVKDLAPLLADSERQLTDITAKLENKSTSDQALLDTLVSLAGGVERATAENVYRFAATRAYDALVSQRMGELREAPIPGTQTLGEFLQHRLKPAMATVAATAQRLASLSERIARTSALLRTRVDIATELQNQELLARLTRGQDMQLRLQSTVEGLSIAAISYYVVSLLLYVGKAGKAAGLPINPEMAAGALIPLVLWAVWRTTKKIHEKLHAEH
ncbi:hypothetical protein LPB72_08705 [Hydrogenophaga crassostreae]|uniref:Egg lysin n=1 Tax=Hydrogenophaga crassostreae TaxID=1763535 RepID=A0A167I741_9BURK|nr:DUF3422 domain-containing protein [Hydrogenophaga crassostreae]AOW11860.1 hypothetical protein LPB072_02245 [Hydrogenophaga crassostreae]OAD42292.1 hypothetical protein LPB72_08705 [Hydrogenophaga crassostreae]